MQKICNVRQVSVSLTQMYGKILVKRGISISRMFANIPTRNYYSRCSSLNVSPEVFAFHLAETNIGEPLLEKKSLTGDDFTHRRMTFLNSQLHIPRIYQMYHQKTLALDTDNKNVAIETTVRDATEEFNDYCEGDSKNMIILLFFSRMKSEQSQPSLTCLSSLSIMVATHTFLWEDVIVVVLRLLR